jgi:glycosyltransferase involved in cell wall biosynthesis
MSMSTKASPDVSVIMPVYNRAWCVAEAIESVMAIKAHRIELIVIDDGSTDETAAVLSDLQVRHSGAMQVLRHPDGANLGIAASRNLGLAAATAPFIAFLDSDDLFLPNRFDRALPWMRAHPHVAAGLEPFELEQDGNLERAPHLTALPLDAEGRIDALAALLRQSLYWTVPVITIRREAFARLGWFDPRFSVGEDTALWLRFAAARAVGVIASEEPVARVRRHQQHSWTAIDSERSWLVFFDALLDVIGWARTRPRLVDREALASLRRRLRSYLIETLSRADLGSRPPLRIWWQATLHSPGLAVDRSVLNNLRRMLRRQKAA